MFISHTGYTDYSVVHEYDLIFANCIKKNQPSKILHSCQYDFTGIQIVLHSGMSRLHIRPVKD